MEVFKRSSTSEESQYASLFSPLTLWMCFKLYYFSYTILEAIAAGIMARPIPATKQRKVSPESVLNSSCLSLSGYGTMVRLKSTGWPEEARRMEVYMN